MLAPARSPEGAVCCIMACRMLPTAPRTPRAAAAAPRARRATAVIAARVGARRGPLCLAAAGGGAHAHRGHRDAALLTCRPARDPSAAERPRPPAARIPRAPAGSARCCHSRSVRPWALPFTRAVPRRSGENPCPFGWDV